ncbi:MAG TPA: AAA family ATPase [Steroidobacteraceae bacterium]|nr:AAA family ATPase [Steroidobacteraceae bacterium]
MLPIATRLVPGSFPHPIETLELRETAISWVVLTGDYAYKIKKPLHLDYLDASTLERRRILCEEELRLNRRFAPELYLEVVAISEGGGFPYIDRQAARQPIEYAVRMRQFARSDELVSQLAADSVPSEELAAFGTQLAAWHRKAAVLQDADVGAVEAVTAQVMGNLASLLERADAPTRPRLKALESGTQHELVHLADLIAARQRDARVRECHGDLHAGNLVSWKGKWLPFDCLEFAPKLRWIDVMSDVAFLYMDLRSRSRPDLAFAFIDGYLESSGDYAGLPLLSFFAVYRALVRAKVDDLDGHSARRDERIATAERLTHAGEAALILMHGPSGSGKSWLSRQLVPGLGAVRVRSDLERRRLLGAEAHTQQADETTYQRLYACAGSALDAGLAVILDATFLAASRRRSFRDLARHHASAYVVIDCRAPIEILEARVDRRMRETLDPSEADLSILHRQLSAPEPFAPDELPAVLQVDTTSPGAVAFTIAQVSKRLRRPEP